MIAELANLPLVTPLLGDIGLSLLQLLLFFCSLWLIFLILIQRGKGGGLTAAFGGGGGDSAFGAKAGDAFTKITIITALVWITLCMVTIAKYNPPDSPDNPFAQNNQVQNTAPGLGAGASMSPEAGGDEAGSGTAESGTAESGTAESGAAGSAESGAAGSAESGSSDAGSADSESADAGSSDSSDN